MAEEFNEEEEVIINQEYKAWKKDAPYLYDFILLHSLDWPSYTFEWLPDVEQLEDSAYHFALISSNSTEAEQCQLQKIRVEIPNDSKCEKYIDSKADKISVVERIQITGEINRARHCPANPKIVAVSSSKGEVILTTTKEPIAKLMAHTAEGYGLSWNSLCPNLLATGNSDKLICIWDIEKNKQQANKILPIFHIAHHSAPVEDVAWHRHHPNIFASCSDDRLVMIWDMRFRSSVGSEDKKPVFEIVAHTDQVYSLDFSPFNQFLFCSGSGDQNLSVWDLRNLTRSFSTFQGKKNSIIKAQWSPFTSTILGSCGYGRTIDIWDLSREKKGTENGRLFRHGGHRSKVVDFGWNMNEKLMVGSVEENNCVHIWEMSKQAYYEEEEVK